MIQSEQSAQCNRLIEKSKNRKILFTLKAWPVIALATIGLCFLTQQVAKLFGIELPDQANIDIVRIHLSRAFDSARHFGNAALLVAQVIFLLPAVEEAIFRGILFKGFCILSRRARRSRPTAVGADVPGGPQAKQTSAVHLHLSPSPLAMTLAILSSALFSAAHYIAQPWPDAAFIALFFFGLAQCWLYKKTDRLWCAILNHGLFNLTNLVLLFVVPTS